MEVCLVPSNIDGENLSYIMTLEATSGIRFFHSIGLATVIILTRKIIKKLYSIKFLRDPKFIANILQILISKMLFFILQKC